MQKRRTRVDLIRVWSPVGGIEDVETGEGEDHSAARYERYFRKAKMLHKTLGIAE